MDANANASTLLTLPPDLINMRSQFFSPDATISLTRVEFDKLWPYMDNIYTLSKRHPPTNDGRRSVYYNCRLFRTKDYTPIDIAKRQRNRSCRTAIGCPAKLKVVFYGECRVEVSRQGPELHNHDLRDIDAAKRNTAIRELAADEVAKGYKPSHVHRNLRGSRCEANREILDAAGGFNLTLKDVHNAGKSWLATHKDIRLQGATECWELQRAAAFEALSTRGWQVTNLDTVRQSDSKFLNILILIIC
jgi:hypothetical protein